MVDFVYRSIINNPSPIDYIIVVVNTTSFHITFIVHVVAVYLSQQTFLVLTWGIKALDQINSLLVLGVVTSLSSCIEFLCFSVCVHVSLSSLLLLGFSVFLCACMSFFLCQCVQVCLALVFLCWEFLCLSVCGGVSRSRLLVLGVSAWWTMISSAISPSLKLSVNKEFWETWSA